MCDTLFCFTCVLRIDELHLWELTRKKNLPLLGRPQSWPYDPSWAVQAAARSARTWRCHQSVGVPSSSSLAGRLAGPRPTPLPPSQLFMVTITNVFFHYFFFFFSMHRQLQTKSRNNNRFDWMPLTSLSRRYPVIQFVDGLHHATRTQTDKNELLVLHCMFFFSSSAIASRHDIRQDDLYISTRRNVRR